MGYNPDVVALAWVGFDQLQSLHEYGAQAALPMWISFMQSYLNTIPEHPLEQPPGIVSIKIDPQTGKRAAPNDPLAQFEYFMVPYVPDEDKAPASGGKTNEDNAPVSDEGALY